MPRKAGPAAKRERVDDVVRERCRVTGKRVVLGHQPGEVAVLEMRQPQLDVLIQAGLVEVVKPPVATAKPDLKKGNGDNVTPSKEGE